jgi:ATP-binding cassette, subfamily C, bacterial CydD
VRALDPRLVRRARSVRALLAADVAIGAATTVFVLLQASLLAWIVARAFHGASLDDVEPELVALLCVFAGRALLAWAFEVAGRRAAAKVLSELRLTLAEERLRKDPGGLDGVEVAELAAASVSGIDPLAAYFGRYLPQVVLACFVPLAVLVWVAVIDVTSALVMLITLPLVPVFMWLIGRYTEERSRERWHALRLLSTHYLDVVRGLPTLRAFNRSGAQTEAIADVSERYRRATMGTLRVGFLSGSVLELAATLGIALVAVTVGVRLDDGRLGLQAGLTVLLLAPELYLPLRQLGAQFHTSVDGLAVADRILALIGDGSAPARERSLVPPSPGVATVELRGVSFAYASRAGLVLDQLDLTLRPCETLAIIGESGAGKSTIASLLLGFAEPQAGWVAVGGADLASCDLEAWRGELAWVPQRPTLFRGTVAENIRLGAAGASDDRVRGAARLAGADRFVRALPQGYDTVVGDGGRPLSAGERRRVALARAFVCDVSLLVLDEPTADLDPESEAVVAEALERLRGERTILLITHRPELARVADRVAVLAGGRCVERDTEVVA